jgi:hypothetical protein
MENRWLDTLHTSRDVQMGNCGACGKPMPRSPAGGGMTNYGRSGSCGEHLGKKTEEVVQLLRKLAYSTQCVLLALLSYQNHLRSLLA